MLIFLSLVQQERQAAASSMVPSRRPLSVSRHRPVESKQSRTQACLITSAILPEQGMKPWRMIHFPQMSQFVQHYKIAQLKRKKNDHIRQRDDTFRRTRAKHLPARSDTPFCRMQIKFSSKPPGSRQQKPLCQRLGDTASQTRYHCRYFRRIKLQRSPDFDVRHRYFWRCNYFRRPVRLTCDDYTQVTAIDSVSVGIHSLAWLAGKKSRSHRIQCVHNLLFRYGIWHGQSYMPRFPSCCQPDRPFAAHHLYLTKQRMPHDARHRAATPHRSFSRSVSVKLLPRNLTTLV